MNDEQRQELQAYANENGRNWKGKLRKEWSDGRDTLRWARNEIGPTGLDRVEVQPQRAYYLVIVRESKTEPFFSHFGDYDRAVVMQEAIDYRDSENLSNSSANVRIVACYPTTDKTVMQSDVDALVAQINSAEQPVAEPAKVDEHPTRFIVTATVTHSRYDMGTLWTRTRQVPAFIINACSEHNAHSIAREIIDPLDTIGNDLHLCIVAF